VAVPASLGIVALDPHHQEVFPGDDHLAGSSGLFHGLYFAGIVERHVGFSIQKKGGWHSKVAWRKWAVEKGRALIASMAAWPIQDVVDDSNMLNSGGLSLI
jgi:hypothetical protein